LATGVSLESDDTALLQKSQVLRHKTDEATEGLPEDVATVSKQLPDGTYLVVPAKNMGGTPAPPPPPATTTTITTTRTPPPATGVMRLEIVQAQHNHGKPNPYVSSGYVGIHELTAFDATGNKVSLSSVCVKNTYETACSGQGTKVCSCNRGWSKLSELTDGKDNNGHCFHLGSNACSNSGDKCCDTWIEFQTTSMVSKLEWLQLWDSSPGPLEVNWVKKDASGQWTKVAKFKQWTKFNSGPNRETFTLQAGAGDDITHTCPSLLLR